MEQDGERDGRRIGGSQKTEVGLPSRSLGEGWRTEVSGYRASASLAKPTGLIGSTLEVNAERVKSIVAQYPEHVLEQIEIRGN
jgi:hypothetical protein